MIPGWNSPPLPRIANRRLAVGEKQKIRLILITSLEQADINKLLTEIAEGAFNKAVNGL